MIRLIRIQNGRKGLKRQRKKVQLTQLARARDSRSADRITFTMNWTRARLFLCVCDNTFHDFRVLLSTEHDWRWMHIYRSTLLFPSCLSVIGRDLIEIEPITIQSQRSVPEFLPSIAARYDNPSTFILVSERKAFKMTADWHCLYRVLIKKQLVYCIDCNLSFMVVIRM